VRSLQIILLLMAVSFLSGCSRGPGDEVLISDIQLRLDQQFSDKLFKIVELTRKGSAPRLDGGEGIYVYYNLELEFLRDYHLISWRGLNVGTLAAILGATTIGIEGFDSDGNNKGDHLSIRGRISYQQQGDAWVASSYTPIQIEESIAVVETLDTPSPDALLVNIRSLLDKGATEKTRSEHDMVTLRELRRSLARIDLGHAELEQFHTFGTGWPTGSYYKFGQAFSDYAKKQSYKIFNYASEGSLENGYRLNTGRIDFALLQSDVAEVLYKGWIEEGQLPSPDLRAIASLWPEAVHVITLEDNGIRTLADVRDKRVAIGSPRSGTRFTAARIWLAAGFERMNHDKVKLLSRSNSIAALETGEVDAIILVGAIPDPAIQDLAQRRDDIYFVPLDQSVISKLAEQNFAYYGQPIPAKTYPGQTESVLTLGMAALLTTNVNTPDKDVEQYMKLMREGTEEISHTFYRAGFISYKTARLGISMPLHPAAEKYYEQVRLQKADESKAKESPVVSEQQDASD